MEKFYELIHSVFINVDVKMYAYAKNPKIYTLLRADYFVEENSS